MYDYSTQTKTPVIRTRPKQHCFFGESLNNLDNRDKCGYGTYIYGSSQLPRKDYTPSSSKCDFHLHYCPYSQDGKIQSLMGELEPVPNKDKLLLIKDLLDVWVENGDLTFMQALEFYIEMAQILTDEE